MSSLAAGLVLALGSSLALNGSFLVQGAGAVTAPTVDARRPLRTVFGLLRSPVWTAGLALGLFGWALYVAALAYAPLSFVQAFAAGGLVLVAPVAVRFLGHPVERRARSGLVVMTAALVVLALGAHGSAGTMVPTAAIAAYLVGAAVLAALLALGGRARAGGEALGLAGGLLYGAADVATEGLATAFRGGGLGAVAVSPLTLLLAAATFGAFLCFQRGLQTGSALRVTALMTAGTNLVSILGGVVVFGDPLGSTPGLVVAHVLALGVVVLAASALAPLQARLGASEPRTPDDGAEPGDRRHAPADPRPLLVVPNEVPTSLEPKATGAALR
jgi:drug/metabolite transporter (DMT)-like permease